MPGRKRQNEGAPPGLLAVTQRAGRRGKQASKQAHQPAGKQASRYFWQAAGRYCRYLLTPQGRRAGVNYVRQKELKKNKGLFAPNTLGAPLCCR